MILLENFFHGLMIFSIKRDNGAIIVLGNSGMHHRQDLYLLSSPCTVYNVYSCQEITRRLNCENH